MRISRRHLVPLALMVLWVTLAARLVFRSSWIDEAVTFWIASAPLSEMFHRGAAFPPHSPLHFLVEHVAMIALGRGEFALRLPSLLAVPLSAAFFACPPGDPAFPGRLVHSVAEGHSGVIFVTRGGTPALEAGNDALSLSGFSPQDTRWFGSLALRAYAHEPVSALPRR